MPRTIRTFRFSLHGVTLAGELTNPAKKLLPVKGCVALPPGGGYAYSEADPGEISDSTDGVIQVGRAYARASGVIADAGDPDAGDGRGAYQSVTTTVIEKLNIREIVYAERIVAQVASRQSPNGDGDPWFTLAGTDIVGLRIAGRPVDVIFEEGLRCARTHEQLVKNIVASEGLAQRLNATGLLRQEAKTAGGLSKQVAKLVGARAEPVRGSLVRGLRIDGTTAIEPDPDLAKACDAEFAEFEVRLRRGLEIRIPLFGRIHLGEIHFGPRTRRLTMLKVDLGCPVEGYYEGGDACDDSGWYPP